MRFILHAAVTLIVLAVVVVVVGLLSLTNLFSATTAPGRFETAVALRVRNMSIPAEARRAQNPFAGQKDAWRTGADHFEDHCAVCHGDDGHGRGEIGQNMSPRVPDMTTARTQALTDGDLFYVISSGVRWTGMPAWKGEHTPEETWRLVSFIRHLPRLTADEMEQIQKASEGHEHSDPAAPGDHHHDDDHGNGGRPPGK